MRATRREATPARLSLCVYACATRATRRGSQRQAAALGGTHLMSAQRARTGSGASSCTPLPVAERTISS